MENLTEDGIQTTIQESFCRTGLHEKHQKIIFATLHIILAIVAFVGNVLIIFALQKPLSLHPPSKLLFGSLASTDLCVGLLVQPIHVAFLMSPDHSERCHFIGRLVNSIGLIFAGVSLSTLTAISVDRLLALSLGLRYRQVVKLGRVRIFVILSWLISLIGAIVYQNNSRFTFFVGCVGILLCLATSTFCYAKVYITLRHHQVQVQDHVHQGQPNGGGSALNIARYRKTVSSAVLVQITLIACYFPYAIVVLVTITRLRTDVLDIAWETASTLAMLNSTLNPFLYCWKMNEVRQAVKDTIRQFWCFSSVMQTVSAAFF